MLDVETATKLCGPAVDAVLSIDADLWLVKSCCRCCCGRPAAEAAEEAPFRISPEIWVEGQPRSLNLVEKSIAHQPPQPLIHRTSISTTTPLAAPEADEPARPPAAIPVGRQGQEDEGGAHEGDAAAPRDGSCQRSEWWLLAARRRRVGRSIGGAGHAWGKPSQRADGPANRCAHAESPRRPPKRMGARGQSTEAYTPRPAPLAIGGAL